MTSELAEDDLILDEACARLSFAADLRRWPSGRLADGDYALRDRVGEVSIRVDKFIEPLVQGLGALRF